MTSQISKDEVRSAIEDKLCAYFAVTSKTATDGQIFQASAMVIREIMSRLLAVESPRANSKEVHYMSMEFLMGRSLMKNAFNLGLSEALTGALEDMGKNATDIFETEPDAGLGNGGLGRLAACYMDSMATLGMEATGYSICYELGIFKQKFKDGRQTEEADNWRAASESWLVPRYEDAVEVRFGGQISAHWDNYGHYTAEHTDYTPVIAIPRDMLIAGYEGKEINKLRLWDAKSPSQLDMYLFSNAEYVKSLEERTMAEVITKVLYPADEKMEGKVLRLKQQYFFVSATAQDIVRKHIEKWGDIRSFGEHHTIQINDTHPTLIIPELMRLFMDEHGLGWDESWEIVKKSVAYTNHTVMSEALERWPQQIIQQLLPRIWEILCEINRRWVNYLIYNFGQDERVGRNLIIRDDQVLMANLCLAACYKVNGVSRLHGEILRNDLFRDLCSLRPDHFTYVTNGIDHRRWLAQINPGLHGLICELLGGEEYLTQPEKLEELVRFADDKEVRRRVLAIKRENKRRFADFARRNDNFAFDPEGIMDVQVKRLHEYKRQLLCAMHIASLQMQLHDDPNRDFTPRTFVFGAKAAAGYKTAKRIIELLLSMQNDINNDPERHQQRPRLPRQAAGLLRGELPRVRRRGHCPRRPGVRADLHRRQGSLRHRLHEADDERRRHDRHARRRERRDVRAAGRREHVPLRPAYRRDRPSAAAGLRSRVGRLPGLGDRPRARPLLSGLRRRKELFRSGLHAALRRRPVHADRGLPRLRRYPEAPLRASERRK